jgi:hypothetical protein
MNECMHALDGCVHVDLTLFVPQTVKLYIFFM